MATRKKKKTKAKKKKKFTIQFSLSLGGLFGLVVVCFCIFLWMFLLGIWAGQTILLPSGKSVATLPFTNPAASKAQKKKSPVKEKASSETSRFTAAEKGPQDPGAAQPDFAEPSYFCLQVAAFKESARAKRAVQTWRSRGYDAFLQSPDDADDSFWRVFIGKFENLSEANDLAARLEKKENAKAFIALLPASKIRIP